ncbi:MAG TPA: cadherin-like domain-containing protein [Acidimicrobiia bacterium]|nr:cadherin-like domain-containing protein [Acidimicrobiia bacterium]
MRRIFRRAAHGGRRVGLALTVAVLAGLTSLVGTVPSARSASAPSTSGYWLVGTDGGIFSYGRASFLGSTGAIPLNQPIVGMAPTPDGRGYWMVASDGGIFAFGDAVFYGSMGGKPLNQPIVAIASTRTGRGYWMVASDGGIFAFGDAPFFGSMGSTHLNKPIVDIAATPTGRGYWMAASDGGIFAFGDAGFFGSTGAIKLAKRIQAMTPTPSGRGYWMVAGDGGVFSFGDAGFFGSAADGTTDKRVVDIAPSATGKGYYMTASNGAVYAYGDAKYYGGASDQHLTHGIISMVALNGGDPPVAGDDTLTVDEDGVATLDALVNDHDPEGGQLTIQAVSTPAHGTATFAIGTIAYRPAPNYRGSDWFTYTVADPQGNTAIGQVSVNVRAINDLPQANDDTVTVSLGAPFTIDVLANDAGLGDGLAALNIISAPHLGSATLSPDGRSIVYTPNKKGADTLRYRIIDNNGDNAEAVVKITVTGGDIAPNAVDIGPIACGAGSCQTDVTKAQGVSLGDNGHISLVGEDQNGSVTVNEGTFTHKGTTISFTPANSSVTAAQVQYQIIDDNNGSAPVQMTNPATVKFEYHNGAPTATNGGDPQLTAFAAADYQLVGHDPDGDPITFVIEGIQDTNGVDPGPLFHFNPDGSFHFDGGPPGTWQVTFHVADDHGNQSAAATFTITTN